MSDFINTIDLLGDDVVSSSIVDKSITEFKDNVLTVARNYSFANCKALIYVNLPNVITVGDSSFSNCSNLETIDLNNVSSIGTGAFIRCTKLKALILRSNTMCTLSNTNAFTYTNNQYLYVPRALLSDDDATMDYRQATNWTKYASKFRALEDYTVDGTTTGELDLTKI